MTVIDRVERVKDLNLTDDQKAKLAELKKEYAPKLKAAHRQFDNVLTADQKKARDDAIKAARDAGKSRREVFQAGTAAVKLTDAQKAKMAEGRKAMEALNKEIIDKVNSALDAGAARRAEEGPRKPREPRKSRKRRQRIRGRSQKPTSLRHSPPLPSGEGKGEGLVARNPRSLSTPYALTPAALPDGWGRGCRKSIRKPSLPSP